MALRGVRHLSHERSECDKWRDTTKCHGLTDLANVFPRIGAGGAYTG